MEKCLDALILALEKIKAQDLKNVICICGDAENLTDIFDENEAEEVENRLDAIRALKKKYGQSKEEIDKYYQKIATMGRAPKWCKTVLYQ